VKRIVVAGCALFLVSVFCQPARGYWDCGGMQSSIVQSDLAVAGRLSDVVCEEPPDESSAALLVEGVAFGAASIGDTLKLVWECPESEWGWVSSLPHPDYRELEGVPALWFLDILDDGTIRAHSRLCCVWRLSPESVAGLREHLVFHPARVRGVRLSHELCREKLERVRAYFDDLPDGASGSVGNVRQAN
jgi:hypothetical protein